MNSVLWLLAMLTELILRCLPKHKVEWDRAKDCEAIYSTQLSDHQNERLLASSKPKIHCASADTDTENTGLLSGHLTTRP